MGWAPAHSGARAAEAADPSSVGSCWLRTFRPACDLHLSRGKLRSCRPSIHPGSPPCSQPFQQRPACPFQSQDLCRGSNQAWPPVGVHGRWCHTCVQLLYHRFAAQIPLLLTRPHCFLNTSLLCDVVSCCRLMYFPCPSTGISMSPGIPGSISLRMVASAQARGHHCF